MNVLPQPTTPLSAERKLELLNGAYPHIYQSEDGIDLHAYCFYPEDSKPNSQQDDQSGELKPAILFFHGGLWDVSMVTQFSPHAMHFASRGMVAIVVEYRVSAVHQSTPDDAFDDAQMAMLWLRHNHQELGIDPKRIVAAGSAGGAHMALSLAMRKKLEVVDGYDPRPQAVIGVSSFVHTNRRNVDHQRFPNAKVSSKLNPYHNVRRKLPPTLMIHGKVDTVAPHYMIVEFVRMMKRKRNRCDLIDFDACNHSFFNFNVSPEHFEITLNSMDAFIAELGYIPPTEYGQ
ncbi:alpha/beta hydrolase [Verrucomicrobiaceae bacterium N1E253]|uniref:Alpha/beta hydrolase n=1 Tax=Oceaniferula marina TaxID=2748318 RepID=A0A851GPT8_9BACT|nr:alpha/beta hydrolase [Oceaniferula marina]NWK56840.1 alpha/beta hydrolase [Oceaniferula marina]